MICPVRANCGQYKVDWGFGFAIMFTLTTQMIGLGLAGVCGRYLVKPAIDDPWLASNLPNCPPCSNTLHDRADIPDPENTSGWSISRFRFFLCESEVHWFRSSWLMSKDVLIGWPGSFGTGSLGFTVAGPLKLLSLG